MADWFHCNKCYLEIRSAQGAKYLLTNCGHIFCEKCFNSGKPNFCYMCHSDCTTIALTSNLSPEIQIFFSDVTDSLQKLVHVLEFQKNHYKKICDHRFQQNQALEQKYIHAKDYIKKMTKQYESLQKDNQRLRNLLKMSIGSPAPGNSSRRNLNDSGSVMVTPTVHTPISGHNSSRTIIRGQPAYSSSAVKHGQVNRGSNQQNFRTPVYIHTPSMASVASSASSRTSMVQGRPNGVPSVHAGPSPSSINLSGLNFRR